MLTRRNHSADNSFLSLQKEKTEERMRLKGYIPIGVSVNVPFCDSKHPHMAFMYEYDGEKMWIHIPRWIWHRYLFEYHEGKCFCEQYKLMDEVFKAGV